MNKPKIKSGKFHAGSNFVCGENVVVDVSEEVVIGDRCVLSDNARLEGRKIEIGNDFYGYSWEWKRLDIGRGRRDSEYATLRVGSRCTFHDNQIDLSRAVFIGNDVGLSPQVTIYTHGYWSSILEGYPAKYGEVTIGDDVIIGFRSVLLAGSSIDAGSVIGAQSVVCGRLHGKGIYGGNPARLLKGINPPSIDNKIMMFEHLLKHYAQTLVYRNINCQPPAMNYPFIRFNGMTINAESQDSSGIEDEFTDDLRDFLFRYGIRIFTQRPFKRLNKR